MEVEAAAFVGWLPISMPNSPFEASFRANGTTGSGCLCRDKNGWMPLVGDGLGECFFAGGVMMLPVALSLFGVSIEALKLRSSRELTHMTLGWRVPVLLVLQLIMLASWVLKAAPLGPSLDVLYISPMLNAIALLPVGALTFIERFRGDKPSGSLLLYWTAALLTNVSAVIHSGSVEAWPEAILAAIALALEYTSERWQDPDSDRRKNPYDQATVFSRLTFTWMSPLMKLGYKQYLTSEDLPNLASDDRTDLCLDQFQEAWSRQLKSAHPSLPRALMRAFGARYAMGGVAKSVQDTMAFVQPQLLRMLIVFVNQYLSSQEVPLSRGIYISFAMFLVSIIQTMALHQYFERSFGTGMRVRSSLINAIFRKALRLSSETRGKRTIGDTVNLMSIDTQRIQDVCPNGHNLWSAPLQITLCLVSLYNLLGNSMWAGVILLAVLIPVNTRIASVQKSLQRDQMKYKDLRTRLTSELLSSIKSIKLYAWEKPFADRLEHARNGLELESIKKIGIFMSLMSFMWTMTPFLVSCSTFGVYAIFAKKPLTTDIVFPALTLFNLLQFPMAMFPMLLSSLIEASVACQRISEFMTIEERQPDAVTHLPRATKSGETAISVSDADFIWQKEPVKPAITDLNLEATKGELLCLVGRVGSGKSAILQCLLGDIHKTKGTVEVHGSVAYVAQQPWILNASVRENILFGLKFDAEIYDETVQACALVDDLAMLPDGDGTLVGEKGISLSGGQKARITLARAVYARSDVYLLDDPLSAVDEHVGRHIIDNVLGKSGLLASKTIVLATNSFPVLRQADRIAMISNGRILEVGSPSDPSELPRISALLAEFGRGESIDSSAVSTATSVVDHDPSPKPLETSSGSNSGDRTVDSSTEDDERDEEEPQRLIQHARKGSMRRASAASLRPSVPTEMSREHMEQGKVVWEVYADYARVCGFSSVLIFVVIMVFSIGLSLAANVWLKHWAETDDSSQENTNSMYFLGIYTILGVASAVLTVGQNLLMFLGINIRSARILHDRMLAAVIRAPMSFFETTPLGRIVNRFSNDVYRVDQQLIRVFYMLFNNALRVMFTIAVICWGTPAFIIIVLPLAVFYLYYQRFYLCTSRELKRLDSVSKSPIFAQFQETLDGVQTVRAFGATSRFEYVNQCYIDQNNKAYFPSISANRWLAVRLEGVGSIIILAAAALSVLALPSGRLSAGLIGLVLSYALQITQALNWIVRMSVEVETNIVSVERMMEYSQLKSEAPSIVPDHRPPEHWPQTGSLSLNHYSTRYRPELPLVLRNINLAIKPGEKIGIVGRTGAGKSSLTLALFRLIEAAEGHITIDDVNTSQIGLYDLRSHLSIIPQDSQVFEGSIRDNLDPAHVHTDAELWRVLDLSHLRPHVEAMDGGLDAAVAEGGSNLSSGQRQLLSLARALLTDTRVLVMDEATAAVDVETDQTIQQVIRKEFADRTILTIAHRLNTIMDSDRVVVLSYGEIAEVGSPAELLERPGSMFRSLAQQGGVNVQ